MAELQKQYQEKQDQKEELKRKAEHTELMLDRAAKLVSGRSILKRLYCEVIMFGGGEGEGQAFSCI